MTDAIYSDDRLKKTEESLAEVMKKYQDLSNGMHELVKVQSEWLKSKVSRTNTVEGAENACRKIIFNLETLKLKFEKDLLWINRKGCSYYDYESCIYELETLDEEIKKYYEIEIEDK